MPNDIEAPVRALLETVPVGVIATPRRDGPARQTTVYFVPELIESELAAAGRVLLRLDADRVYGAAHLAEEVSR